MGRRLVFNGWSSWGSDFNAINGGGYASKRKRTKGCTLEENWSCLFGHIKISSCKSGLEQITAIALMLRGGWKIYLQILRYFKVWVVNIMKFLSGARRFNCFCCTRKCWKLDIKIYWFGHCFVMLWPLLYRTTTLHCKDPNKFWENFPSWSFFLCVNHNLFEIIIFCCTERKCYLLYLLQVSR